MARSFQLVNIFPLLSVRETIAVAAISNLGQGGRIFASLRANKSVWDIVERVAHLFGFTAKFEQPAKSLSQGDKKLLDVASAFALKPEIILLDEPTSGVSTAEKATIMRGAGRGRKTYRHQSHHPGRARHGYCVRLFEPHYRGA